MVIPVVSRIAVSVDHS